MTRASRMARRGSWLISTKINGLGWRAGIPLEAGIRSTYEWFLGHVE